MAQRIRRSEPAMRGGEQSKKTVFVLFDGKERRVKGVVRHAGE